MMRSMYSAVSGLKTHQTKMDVIGNNIANVNTVAFKSSSVTFRDILYQTTSGASGALVKFFSCIIRSGVTVSFRISFVVGSTCHPITV